MRTLKQQECWTDSLARELRSEKAKNKKSEFVKKHGSVLGVPFIQLPYSSSVPSFMHIGKDVITGLRNYIILEKENSFISRVIFVSLTITTCYRILKNSFRHNDMNRLINCIRFFTHIQIGTSI